MATAGNEDEAVAIRWRLVALGFDWLRDHLWEVDHIVPVADGGGELGEENLRALCIPCHRSTLAKPPVSRDPAILRYRRPRCASCSRPAVAGAKHCVGHVGRLDIIGPGVARRHAIVLAAIVDHVAERHYPPTSREIAKRIGTRDHGEIDEYLSDLERSGCIRRAKDAPSRVSLLVKEAS